MGIQTLKTNHVAQLMALGIAGVLIDRLAAVVHDVSISGYGYRFMVAMPDSLMNCTASKHLSLFSIF